MKLFDVVKANRPKRNVFDLSHEKKMSMKMGKLVPFLCEDVIPGDKWQVNSEQLVRLAPMIAPVMHRVDVYTHFFFVPNRLVWNNWAEFITGGEDAGDEGYVPPVFPKQEINSSNYLEYGSGKLADYLGYNVPAVAPVDPIEVSALPFRAYQLIYNEYYRDQNLSAKIDIYKGDGVETEPQAGAIRGMRNRAWEKDYFTSCLPWTQKGGEVLQPLTGTAPVVNTVDGTNSLYVTPATPWNGAAAENIQTDTGVNDTSPRKVVSTDDVNPQKDLLTNLEADLTGATATTVNDLRKAVRLQEWLERNARGGSRYIEQILSHFGVKSSDARLQRPEYLGGGKNAVMMSEVLQTSASKSDVQVQDTPQGNMAGHGISVGKSNRFKRHFEEHGQIIAIMSVLPRTAYQQGLRRQFTKFDKFDYFWPEFAHLGEQPVLNKELYIQGTSVADENTFGYQSRYAEYKYCSSTVHGDFKGNLDFWHMGRQFDALPPLNGSFVEADPTKRIFAVEDPNSDELWVSIYNDIKAIRPMPYHGTPYL